METKHARHRSKIKFLKSLNIFDRPTLQWQNSAYTRNTHSTHYSAERYAYTRLYVNKLHASGSMNYIVWKHLNPFKLQVTAVWPRFLLNALESFQRFKAVKAWCLRANGSPWAVMISLSFFKPAFRCCSQRELTRGKRTILCFPEAQKEFNTRWNALKKRRNLNYVLFSTFFRNCWGINLSLKKNPLITKTWRKPFWPNKCCDAEGIPLSGISRRL